MDRFRQLTQLWSWLPAFRAVAEAEHLPTAARRMGVTPSALSRAVAQLEQALGRKLFARVGRGLRLEPAGKELLGAVRDAMRRIDDGLGAGTPDRPSKLLVAGDGVWVSSLVAPACGTLAIELEHVEHPRATLRDGLVRGAIDLAIVEAIAPTDELVIERLGSVAQAVYGAPHGRATVLATCTTRADDWPAELARAVRFRSANLDAVIEACRAGAVRAVLPVAIARARGLARYSKPAAPASALYLARRPALGTSAVETIVPAIRTRAHELLGGR